MKVGWSKKNKTEYEHRAPRSVVQAVADALDQMAQPGRIFRAVELLPVYSKDEEVPSYQSYLVLGWLQSAGVIEKKGRDGYIRWATGNGRSDLGALWESLSQKVV